MSSRHWALPIRGPRTQLHAPKGPAPVPESLALPLCPLAGQQDSGNPRPHTQLCQDLPLSTNDLTPALGSLGPAARFQYLALAASSLTLTSGPGFTLLAHECQISAKTWPCSTACRCRSWDVLGQTTNWVGIQPRVLCRATAPESSGLTPSISEPAPALGRPRVLQAVTS